VSKANLFNEGNTFPCAIQAWAEHEDALVRWLLKETDGNKALCEDILQEVFIKLLQQREAFCGVKNTQAWLITVARHLLIDYQRRDRYLPLDDALPLAEEETELVVVDLLAHSCLPRVLSELDENDRYIIQQCDIHGIKQNEFAQQHGLSLSATKSRLRRARLKLKQKIETACQVQLDENEQVCCFTPRSG
jgi:RNA polymerase sigma-70 factor (ECF subfamily)